MSGTHTAAAAGGGSGSSSSHSVLPASALASRKLAFNASLPLLIELADPPASKTGAIAQYYTKVPRISYLPLLLPHLRKYFLESLLDDAALLTLKDDQLWFEFQGQPLRWHWPVGLLYDVHTANAADTAIGSAGTSNGALAVGGRPTSTASSPGRLHLDSYFAAPPTAGAPTSATATTIAAPSSSTRASTLPWRIKLHLKSPPTDKLNMAPSIEACRTNFMSMVKEADFVRFGTTRRVVNLRRTEQDALWEGVVEHDFEKYWSVASRLLPPLSAPAPSSSSSISTAPTTASASEPSSSLDNGFHALSISPSRTPSLVPSIASSSAASSSTNVANTNRHASGGGPSSSSSGFTTTEGGTVKGSTSPYAVSSPAIGGGVGAGGAASQSSFSVATQSEAGSVLGDVTVTHPSAGGSGAGGATAGGGGSGSGSGSGIVAHGGWRHVPIRIHLPDGAPVVQEPVAPYFDDGRPKPLLSQLSALFPLLFPPAPSFASFAPPSPPLAYVVIQGIRVPLEAEIPWLGAVLGGADGWLSVVVHLNPEP